MDLYLEYTGSIRRPPRVEEVVFSGADEPLATVGEFERQHAALVKVELVLVRLVVMQNFYITALHTVNNKEHMEHLELRNQIVDILQSY